MAVQNKRVESRPKIEKAGTAGMVTPEEIEITLGFTPEEQEPSRYNREEAAKAAARWQEEFDALKHLHQKTQNEMTASVKHLQATTEKALRELEAARQERQEAGQHRRRLEDSIHELETKLVRLSQTGTAAADTTTEPKLGEASQPPASQPIEPVFKNIEMQLVTIAHAAPTDVAIETTLQLSGADAIKLTQQKAEFQAAWYARRLAGDGSFTLNTSTIQLAENQLQYALKTVASRLPAGLYRLTTVVTFPAHRHLMAYYQGPIIQISEA
jgi:hypothetical protein